ncbi:MAG: hypothetical protein ABI147_12755 [Acidobacteriaceae bacterium]
MNNAQLYISIGLPTLLVMIGLLLNWTATKDVATRLGVIESDMRQFYRAIGKLEGRMGAVEK